MTAGISLILGKTGARRAPLQQRKAYFFFFEAWKEIFLPFSNIRNRLSVRLHNLKVLVVNPDLTLKVPLVLFDRLRRDIENKTVDLIDHFFSEIFQVVLSDVVTGEDEGLNF